MPILFALLALICFGGAALSSNAGAVALVVLGVVSISIAIYAWMIL